MVLYLFHVAKLSHKILPVKKLHLYLIVTFFSLLQKTSGLRGEKNRKKNLVGEYILFFDYREITNFAF